MNEKLDYCNQSSRAWLLPPFACTLGGWLLSALLSGAASAAPAPTAPAAALPPATATPAPMPATPGAPPSLEELIAGIPQDMLADLHSADFLTVRGLTASLPHGDLTIKHGVIASYKHPERRTAGIVIGECELTLDRLPQGPDTFNIFTGMFADKKGQPIIARQSFLTASPTGAAQLKDVGFVAAMRKWDSLKPEEQAQFTKVLALAWGSTWCDNAASLAQKCFVPRDPKDGEVFGAVWLEGFPDAGPDGLTRIDFRVEADGKTTTAAEHDSGKLLMQYPYQPGAPASDAAAQAGDKPT